MINFETTILVMVNIVFTIVSAKIFFSIFFIKKQMEILFVIPICFLSLWQAIILIFSPTTAVVICINIVLISIFGIWTYKGNLYIKIAFSILYMAIWVLIEFFVGYFFLLLDIDIRDASFYGSIISKLVTVGLIFIFKLLKEKSNISSYSQRYSLIIFAVPIFSLVLMYIVFYYNLQEITKVDVRLSMLLVGIVIFANIIVLKVYQLLIQKIEIKEKHERYVQQFQMKKEHNEEIELMINDIRKMNHDIKHHLITIRGYLYESNVNEAYNYLDNLLEERTNKIGISSTKNIAIDSTINSKYWKMKKHNIVFKSDINIPALIPFCGADLSILVGNILDNAIEANEKELSQKKFINLYITYESNYLIVCCVNSYDGTLTHNKNDIFQTLKKDKENHGFGIASIKNLCRKYNGQATFEYSINTFTVKSVLFINSRNNE